MSDDTKLTRLTNNELATLALIGNPYAQIPHPLIDLHKRIVKVIDDALFYKKLNEKNYDQIEKLTFYTTAKIPKDRSTLLLWCNNPSDLKNVYFKYRFGYFDRITSEFKSFCDVCGVIKVFPDKWAYLY